MKINKPAIATVILGVLILVMLGSLVWSVMQIQQLEKEVQKSEAQLCFISELLLGSAQPERRHEVCTRLRNELHEEWQKSIPLQATPEVSE